MKKCVMPGPGRLIFHADHKAEACFKIDLQDCLRSSPLETDTPGQGLCLSMNCADLAGRLYIVPGCLFRLPTGCKDPQIHAAGNSDVTLTGRRLLLPPVAWEASLRTSWRVATMAPMLLLLKNLCKIEYASDWHELSRWLWACRDSMKRSLPPWMQTAVTNRSYIRWCVPCHVGPAHNFWMWSRGGPQEPATGWNRLLDTSVPAAEVKVLWCQPQGGAAQEIEPEPAWLLVVSALPWLAVWQAEQHLFEECQSAVHQGHLLLKLVAVLVIVWFPPAWLRTAVARLRLWPSVDPHDPLVKPRPQQRHELLADECPAFFSEYPQSSNRRPALRSKLWKRRPGPRRLPYRASISRDTTILRFASLAQTSLLEAFFARASQFRTSYVEEAAEEAGREQLEVHAWQPVPAWWQAWSLYILDILATNITGTSVNPWSWLLNTPALQEPARAVRPRHPAQLKSLEFLEVLSLVVYTQQVFVHSPRSVWLHFAEILESTEQQRSRVF